MKAVGTKDGQIVVAEQPVPQLEANHVLVQTEYSAISPGTEMMMSSTLHSTFVSLGYSSSGIVQAVGEGVRHIQVGQRVACYGAPYVKHAETLCVPKHLAVPVPDSVSAVEASTVGLGAIVIHALRQAQLQFGETVVVVGLGILGQLAAQISQAVGYQVIAHDIASQRCDAAEALGLKGICRSTAEIENRIKELTRGNGVDAVLICASSKSGELINQGLHWLRDRGKIVVLGDLKMDFSRDLMFMKEAQILISRAGGPGRYDDSYERDGVDYPIGFARWTEGRNMEAYIRLIADGGIHVKPLISHVMPMQEAVHAYRLFKESPQHTMGVILDYASSSTQRDSQSVLSEQKR